VTRMRDKRMNTSLLTQHTDCEWHISPVGGMRVPGIIYGDGHLIADMDSKVYEQVCNVAKLPGIVNASFAMPDAHWGYGFPIGGVAAFDAEAGGVISAGGVGFDISCGVRTLHTGLIREQVEAAKVQLADKLFARIPAGVGSTGALRLSAARMDDILAGGAVWAVRQGWGTDADLERIEEGGMMRHAKPRAVSALAKRRQRDEMGTLGPATATSKCRQWQRSSNPDLPSSSACNAGRSSFRFTAAHAAWATRSARNS